MKANFSYLLFLVIILCSACDKEVMVVPEPMPMDSIHQYLFLGHINLDKNTVDERIEQADFSAYQQLWLGGDICSETTQEESTVDYVDDLFDLSSPTTHWTLGNHDVRNGNIDWLTDRTQRPTFYAHYFNGITLLVLNTNYRVPDDCAIMGEQMTLIRNVCDTISESTHLIVLMHHLIWGFFDETIDDITNAPASWLPFECDPLRRFEHIIYPEFLKTNQRGVSVICIGGDMGQQTTRYEYRHNEEMVFLASGITSEKPWNEQFPTHGLPDEVLVLTHNLTVRQLTWAFIHIDDI